MILILAPGSDVHARRVAQEIASLGATAQLLDWRHAGTGLRASMCFDRGGVGRSVREAPDAPELDLKDIRAVWNRRPGFPSIAEEVLKDEHRQFALHEWQDLTEGMIQSMGPSTKVVSPSYAQRAATKPAQLAAAHRVGLRVPDTLITSDPTKAAEFIERHSGRVVHKAMTGPRTLFLETQLWQDSNRSELQQLPLAPTIFQELIEGPKDIRVTIVGDEVYAASIDSSESRAGIDSRLDMDVPVASFELLEATRCQLLALMRDLGLSFSTVDLKITADEELYFLELNPQGQFLYVEILTGQPIAAAMARFLVAA
jgi:MvdD pre-ATP grasp domain/RimK-like ATP-grasp domain